MCYICEANGHVGANYKAAQKEIAAALRVWPKRERRDLLTAPPVGSRLWSNADLKAYGKQYQERVSP